MTLVEWLFWLISAAWSFSLSLPKQTHTAVVYFRLGFLVIHNIAQVPVKPIKCRNWGRPCLFILWEGLFRASWKALRKLLSLSTPVPSLLDTAWCHIHQQTIVNPQLKGLEGVLNYFTFFHEQQTVLFRLTLKVKCSSPE